MQLHGGNGYMAEYHVEQLARDAKVLQIYAGTDEIQTRAIAKSLFGRLTTSTSARRSEASADRSERGTGGQAKTIIGPVGGPPTVRR